MLFLSLPLTLSRQQRKPICSNWHAAFVCGTSPLQQRTGAKAGWTSVLVIKDQSTSWQLLYIMDVYGSSVDRTLRAIVSVRRLVCAFVGFFSTRYLKNRCIKRDLDLMHRESWKPIYFEVNSVTRHKKNKSLSVFRKKERNNWLLLLGFPCVTSARPTAGFLSQPSPAWIMTLLIVLACSFHIAYWFLR